jgi:hypothetical protein
MEQISGARPLLGGLAALTALVRVERRAPDPPPPRFFASRVRWITALP